MLLEEKNPHNSRSNLIYMIDRILQILDRGEGRTELISGEEQFYLWQVFSKEQCC